MDYSVTLSEEDWIRIANFLDPEKDDSRLYSEPIENLTAKIQEQVLAQKLSKSVADFIFAENPYDSNESSFEVYDNGSPAVIHGSNPDWNNYKFNSFYDALVYAREWLGPAYNKSRDGLGEANITVNQPYYYDHGDFIEIREIKNV